MTRDEVRAALREELAGTGFEIDDIRDWFQREDGTWTFTLTLVAVGGRSDFEIEA